MKRLLIKPKKEGLDTLHGGLLGESERKNLSQMAENAIGVEYHQLHHFLTEAPSCDSKVNELRLGIMNKCSQTRISRGFSLIIDDSGHRKSGNNSQNFSIRQAAWYAKPLPTFVDAFVEDVGGAIALVRQSLWSSTFSMSHPDTDMVKIPRALLERLTDTLGYAA